MTAVQETSRVQGVEVEVLPVDADGVADLAWLRERLGRWDAADGKPFVALMLANNETGVIQPVAEAAEIVRAADGWLHVDAIQAAGKIADRQSRARRRHPGDVGPQARRAAGRGRAGRSVRAPPCHAASTAAARSAVAARGTENLPGIAGFGAAAVAARAGLDDYQARAAWRDARRRTAQSRRRVVMGEAAPRLPQHPVHRRAGVRRSDLQVMGLDLAQVMISAGSACSSGKVKASPC